MWPPHMEDCTTSPGNGSPPGNQPITMKEPAQRQRSHHKQPDLRDAHVLLVLVGQNTPPPATHFDVLEVMIE